MVHSKHVLQVMKATQESLQRDQQASLMLGGRDVTCMSPVGKSYSKSTINGVSSVSVGLQMPARGNGKMVSVENVNTDCVSRKAMTAPFF